MINEEFKLGDEVLFLSPDAISQVGYIHNIDDVCITIETATGLQWTWYKYRFFKIDDIKNMLEKIDD